MTQTPTIFSDLAAQDAENLAELERVVTCFLQHVEKLPYVQRVLLESTAGRRRVWTVISAPPFDTDYRNPVRDAEVEALAASDIPVVGFRLINLREIEDDPVKVLPTPAFILYQRPAIA
jgi:hypothetical protein